MNPVILMTLGDKIDSTFFSFDIWIFKFFASIQNGFFSWVAKFFTSFGDEAFVIPMAVVAVLLCFFKKTRKFGFTLLFAIAVGTIITNVVVKPMALRIRPYNTLQNTFSEFNHWYIAVGSLSESDYSFPSGHTTAAFEMATALFICFKQNKKKIAYLFPVIALCTAGSRIYLMVHYPTDVIAGIIVGILSGVIGYFLMKLAMKILSIKKGNKTLDEIIDAEKLFDKITGNGFRDDGKKILLNSVLIIAVAVIFITSFVPVLKESKEHPPLCNYHTEYDCKNKARHEDSKYPPIYGKEYCKIHWKELNGEQ